MSFTIAQRGTTAEVQLMGVIGWDVEAKGFVEQLNAIDAEVINLRIHSDGGEVMQGWAMFQALQRHSARVVAYIEGWAVSMASVIMLAADEVVAYPSSMVMIHNPWTSAGGSAEDLERAAELNKTIRAQLVAAYVEATGQSEATITQMMDAETWMDAEQAKALGFVDRVETSGAAQTAAQLGKYTPPTTKEAPQMPDKTIDEAVEVAKTEARAEMAETHARLTEELTTARAEIETTKAQLVASEAKAKLAEESAELAVTEAMAAKEAQAAADAKVTALTGGLETGSNTARTFTDAQAAIKHYESEGMTYTQALNTVITDHTALHTAWIDQATGSNPHR